MYLSLYFMRDISRQEKQMQLTKNALLIFVIKAILNRTRWRTKISERPMRQAARASKSLARRIRYVVLTGILMYREKVFVRQYF